MKVLVSTVFLFVGLSSGLQAQEIQDSKKYLMFRDDFISDINNWPIGSHPDFYGKLATKGKGLYLFYSKEKDSKVTRRIIISDTTNFLIKARVTVLMGSFEFNHPKDLKAIAKSVRSLSVPGAHKIHFGGLVVEGSREIRFEILGLDQLLRVIEKRDEEWENLVPEKKDRKTMKKMFNELLIEKSGNSLSFYINNFKIHSLEAHDLWIDSIGFVIEGPTGIAVDWVSVEVF